MVKAFNEYNQDLCEGYNNNSIREMAHKLGDPNILSIKGMGVCSKINGKEVCHTRGALSDNSDAIKLTGRVIKLDWPIKGTEYEILSVITGQPYNKIELDNKTDEEDFYFYGETQTMSTGEFCSKARRKELQKNMHHNLINELRIKRKHKFTKEDIENELVQINMKIIANPSLPSGKNKLTEKDIREKIKKNDSSLVIDSKRAYDKLVDIEVEMMNQKKFASQWQKTKQLSISDQYKVGVIHPDAHFFLRLRSMDELIHTLLPRAEGFTIDEDTAALFEGFAEGFIEEYSWKDFKKDVRSGSRKVKKGARKVGKAVGKGVDWVVDGAKSLASVGSDLLDFFDKEYKDHEARAKRDDILKILPNEYYGVISKLYGTLYDSNPDILRIKRVQRNGKDESRCYYHHYKGRDDNGEMSGVGTGLRPAEEWCGPATRNKEDGGASGHGDHAGKEVTHNGTPVEKNPGGNIKSDRGITGNCHYRKKTCTPQGKNSLNTYGHRWLAPNLYPPRIEHEEEKRERKVYPGLEYFYKPVFFYINNLKEYEDKLKLELSAILRKDKEAVKNISHYTYVDFPTSYDNMTTGMWPERPTTQFCQPFLRIVGKHGNDDDANISPNYSSKIRDAYKNKYNGPMMSHGLNYILGTYVYNINSSGNIQANEMPIADADPTKPFLVNPADLQLQIDRYHWESLNPKLNKKDYDINVACKYTHKNYMSGEGYNKDCDNVDLVSCRYCVGDMEVPLIKPYKMGNIITIDPDIFTKLYPNNKFVNDLWNIVSSNKTNSIVSHRSGKDSIDLIMSESLDVTDVSSIRLSINKNISNVICPKEFLSKPINTDKIFRDIKGNRVKIDDSNYRDHSEFNKCYNTHFGALESKLQQRLMSGGYDTEKLEENLKLHAFNKVKNIDSCQKIEKHIKIEKYNALAITKNPVEMSPYDKCKLYNPCESRKDSVACMSEKNKRKQPPNNKKKLLNDYENFKYSYPDSAKYIDTQTGKCMTKLTGALKNKEDVFKAKQLIKLQKNNKKEVKLLIDRTDIDNILSTPGLSASDKKDLETNYTECMKYLHQNL